MYNIPKVTFKGKPVRANESIAVSLKPNNVRLMTGYTAKYSRLKILVLPDHGCCLLVTSYRTDIISGI